MSITLTQIFARRLMLLAGLCIASGTGFALSALDTLRQIGNVFVSAGAIELFIALVWIGMLRRQSIPDELKISQDRFRKIVFAFSASGIFLILIGLIVLLGISPEIPNLPGTGWGVMIHGLVLLLLSASYNNPEKVDFTLPDIGIYSHPRHQPFSIGIGSRAVLLVHGYPGSPHEMRALAERIAASGWRADAISLPGQGQEIRNLFSASPLDWLTEVESCLNELKLKHKTVVLMGFSMGGALAAIAASRKPVDGLVLLSPFSMPFHRILSPVVWLLRPLLPASVRIGQFIDLESPIMAAAAHELLAELSITTAAAQSELNRLRVPTQLVDQTNEINAWFHASLKNLMMPTLIVQGCSDPIVRPSVTRALAKQLPNLLNFLEVNGGHEITLEGREGFSETAAAVLSFLSRYDK